MSQKLKTYRGGFTLVEIMIVVAIIALLAAIAVPNFLRSRKRSQATQILEDLHVIDGAVDQYAIEFKKSPGDAVAWADVQQYIKTGSRLYSSNAIDVLGNPMGYPEIALFMVDQPTAFSQLTFNALSDVAPADFWSPFIPN